jgi:hypothetical protein
MDYKRLSIAAVVAWIVDSIYGYLVYGVMMREEFAKYPAVFRPEEALDANLPLLLGGTLLGLLAMTYIYAKGYEGGSGLQEGLRFGIVLGIFMFGMVSIGSYVVYNFGRRLAFYLAVAGFIETIIDGIVIGMLYRPPLTKAVTGQRKAVAV